MSADEHPGTNGTGNLEGELKDVVSANANQEGANQDRANQDRAPEQPSEPDQPAASTPSPYPSAEPGSTHKFVSKFGPVPSPYPSSEPAPEPSSQPSEPELVGVGAATAPAAVPQHLEPQQSAPTTHITAYRHTAAEPTAPAKPYRSAGRAARKVLKLLATVVRLIGLLAAVILVAYVIFVASHANPANYLTAFISEWAHRLNLHLDNLFTPKNALLTVVIDYGIAAILWLVVCSLVARILRRL